MHWLAVSWLITDDIQGIYTHFIIYFIPSCVPGGEMHVYCIQTYGYMEGKQQLLLLLKGRLADIFEQDQYRCLQIYQYLIDYDIYVGASLVFSTTSY